MNKKYSPKVIIASTWLGVWHLKNLQWELSKSEFLKREEPATCPIAFKDQSLSESFSEGTFHVLESVH